MHGKFKFIPEESLVDCVNLYSAWTVASALTDGVVPPVNSK